MEIQERGQGIYGTDEFWDHIDNGIDWSEVFRQRLQTAAGNFEMYSTSPSPRSLALLWHCHLFDKHPLKHGNAALWGSASYILGSLRTFPSIIFDKVLLVVHSSFSEWIHLLSFS